MHTVADYVVMWKRTYYVTMYICNNGNFPQTQIPNLEGLTTLYTNYYHDNVVNPVEHVVIWKGAYYVIGYICNTGNFP